MESPTELKYLGNIGEFNSSSKQCLSFQAIHCREKEYDLYISFLHTCRIIACRFSKLPNLLESEEIITDQTRNRKEDTILIKYWKSFCLPFCLEDFLLTKDGVWVLGDECYSNVKSYLLPHLDSHCQNEDTLMDVDDDEFELRNFEHDVDLPTTLRHQLSPEKFCVRCNLLQKGVVMGSRDGEKLRLSAVSSYFEPVLNAELSEMKRLLEVTLDPVKSDSSFRDDHPPPAKPVFELCPVQLGGCRSNVLRNLLSSSTKRNCVGFLGCPDGKISYFHCTWPIDVNALANSIELKELYDMEQPVLGIHVVQNIGGIRGTSVIAVGSLGRVVCLSDKSLASRSKEIVIGDNSTLHANVYELFSSVRQHAMFRDRVFFSTAEGKMFHAEFSGKEGVRQKSVLALSKSGFLMQGVVKFLLLDDSDGLFLVLDDSGSLNLYQFSEKEKGKTDFSLPVLMNQAMVVSSTLQKLNTTKALQTRFFEAVSTFASIKFKGIKDMKIHFSYSVTDVKSPPRKFISIAAKGLDCLKMEPEFWVLSATAFSRFEKNCPIVSKTMPLDPENPSICLELDESVFRSWHSTSIPLVVEVGFILTLPEDLKGLDCFQIIERELPLFVKAKEFVLDELSFMEPSTNRGATNRRFHDDRLTRDVIEYGKRRPIYPLLRPECSFLHSDDFPDCFKFGILQSSAERVVHLDTPDVQTQWLQSLLRKAIQNSSTALNVKCRGKAATISASTVNSHIVFNIHAEAFDLLVGIRMAITKRLVMLQDLTGQVDASAFKVSPQLRKDCEGLSMELQALYGQNVDSKSFGQEIRNKYKALRSISSKLIYC